MLHAGGADAKYMCSMLGGLMLHMLHAGGADVCTCQRQEMEGKLPVRAGDARHGHKIMYNQSGVASPTQPLNAQPS